MLEGEKILITGATGKIAFPIARALAGNNEVWGVARLHDVATVGLVVRGAQIVRAFDPRGLRAPL